MIRKAALRCTQSESDNSRCEGLLALDSTLERPVYKCSNCGSSYQSVASIPILKESLSQELDDGLENDVYAGKSRTESLNGEDLYLEQSSEFWEFLPDFCHQHSISGPCLEVGCGLGIFADRVPGFVGLDYALSALLAEGFEGYEKVCASGHNLPFQDQQFELIYSLNTYEHVPFLNEAFEEADRVLKPGGYLVLKPAWNCCQYNCDGVGYFPYSQLSLKNKLLKLMLPILRSFPYKIISRIPRRIRVELLPKKMGHLRYKVLHPRFDLLRKVADSEAFSAIDPFDAICWFRSRGYTCISHTKAMARIKAGHDIVMLKKAE